MMKKTGRMAALLVLVLPILGGAQELESAKAASGLRFSENSGPGDMREGPPPAVEADGGHGSQTGNLGLSQPEKQTRLSEPVPPPAHSEGVKRSSLAKAVAIFTARNTLGMVGGGMIGWGMVSGDLPLMAAGGILIAIVLVIK